MAQILTDILQGHLLRQKSQYILSRFVFKFRRIRELFLVIIVSKAHISLFTHTRGNLQGDLVTVMANDGNWISRSKHIVYIILCGKFILHLSLCLWILLWFPQTNLSYFEVMPDD